VIRRGAKVWIKSGYRDAYVGKCGHVEHDGLMGRTRYVWVVIDGESRAKCFLDTEVVTSPLEWLADQVE